MIELKAANRRVARSLIEKLPSSIYALSVVDDRSDGRVFVDDAANPTIAVAWETTGNLFISSMQADGAELDRQPSISDKGSAATSPGTIADVKHVLLNEYITEAVKSKARPMCWVGYSPEGWGQELDSIMAGHPPMPDTRFCYRAIASDDTAIARLSELAKAPSDCEVKPADRELFESNMHNVDEVRAEAQKMWGTLDRFLSEGFGYCVTSGEAITSWSLTECPSGDRISVGVETVEEFQRRGHATAAAARTLLRCRKEGLIADWDLYASNTPSMKLAERLGLTRVSEYPIRFFWFSRLDNLMVNGNVALKRGRAVDAAAWFDKAFEQESWESGIIESWLLRMPARRAWWMETAAGAYEKAGVPRMSKEMRERAAREKGSAGPN